MILYEYICQKINRADSIGTDYRWQVIIEADDLAYEENNDDTRTILKVYELWLYKV